MKLHDIGWNDRFESLFVPFKDSSLIPARVTRVDRGAVTVLSETGTTTASIAGRLSPDGESGQPAVGDWVGIDPRESDGVVRVVLPRTGSLARRRPGEGDREQVAAANVDLVLVVESLDRGPNPRRIERASAIAWDGGATPVVVLTKLDLCADLDASVATAREGAPFADVLTVSAKTGEGIDVLEGLLVARSTAVLLGPSGVGKSTLTNRLLGEQRLAVAEVREGDRKGRHTTTFRELVVLPGGACLIDTPGVRELGLWLDAGGLGAAFPEIEEAAGGCRFGDCRHETEPGCAVLQAVERGDLDPARLASFLRLRREAENLEMRRDESKRYEVRARERSFGKMIRRALKQKNGR
ncbi:MAG: ribosome small subunit-dependent GTPase A [Thermoanaerobaculales bacterium]|nr:ribosome small subunit-dependent GTPase A [Thermoanaerobaculales bacterium]